MKRITEYITILLFFIILFVASSNAQEFWQPSMGPYAGYINDLATNQNGDIFAVAFGSVFRSTDNGNIWMGVNHGLYNPSLSSISIREDGVIFLGVEYLLNDWGGVFRSTDNGDNWSLVGSLISVTSLAINSSGHIFAVSGSSRVYLSTDNGDNWINVRLKNFSIFKVDSDSQGYIYAGTSLGNVFISTDNGTSWEEIGKLVNSISSFTFLSGNSVLAGTFG